MAEAGSKEPAASTAAAPAAVFPASFFLVFFDFFVADLEDDGAGVVKGDAAVPRA